MSMNLSDIVILNIKGADYHCIISGISKSEAINLPEKCQSDWKKYNIIENKNLLKLNIRSNFEAVNLLQILI